MKAGFFRSPEEFVAANTDAYRLLPFRFMRWSAERTFISTDAGEWTFLSNRDFSQFVSGKLERTSQAYGILKGKHVLADSDVDLPVHLLATKLRTKYAFLEGFTSLHIFVVSLRCDHSCPYCQVSRVTEDRVKYDMSDETAARGVEWMFQSPAPLLKVEFQGGESLLNFERVRAIVEMVKARNQTEQREIEFVIATNLSTLSDEVLSYCLENGVLLSSSLDGPEALHNKNRPRPGSDSHQRFVSNLAKARATLGHDRIAALMTTTEQSLLCPEDIVDEYVRLKFSSVFVRPISPYGFAVRGKQGNRYQVEAFLAFYRRALARVIDWNKKGVSLVESYTQLLLRRLLTPFPTGYVDLQSPAGLGISVLVYNYDGDVYASDEGRMLAEMGDASFRLGNLQSDDYSKVMGGAYLQSIVAESCTTGLPQCSDCAFVPFCGSDPVYNWTTQGDIAGHRPTSGFCQKHMSLFTSTLNALDSGDEFTQSLMIRWATT